MATGISSRLNKTEAKPELPAGQPDGKIEIPGSDDGNPNPGSNEGNNPAPKPAAQAGQEPAKPELSEEELLAILKQKTGLQIDALGQLAVTAAAQTDPEEERQKREASVRAWGLQQKIISPQDLDQYAIDSQRNAEEIGYELYATQRIAALKAAKVPEEDFPANEKLRDEFEQLYHLNLPQGDPLREAGVQTLQSAVSNFLSNKYNKIQSLDSEYLSFHEQQDKRAKYNATVNSAFAKLGDTLELTIPIDPEKNETFPVKIKLPAAVLEKIKSSFGSDTTFGVYGDKLDEAMLMEAARTSLIQGNFNEILREAAIGYASHVLNADKKGRRGIPGEGVSGQPLEKPVNKAIKARLEETNY